MTHQKVKSYRNSTVVSSHPSIHRLEGAQQEQEEQGRRNKQH